MERIDLYDEERIPTGKTVERREHRPNGAGDDLRLVVHVCMFNSAGQMLLQRRSMKKDAYPGFWDVSAAGGVAAGETGRQGAEREVWEELGYRLDLTGVRPSMTVNYDGGFDDFYLVVRDDLDVGRLNLQEEEVADARWASREEVRSMLEQGEFVPYPVSFVDFLFEMRDTFGFHGK